MMRCSPELLEELVGVSIRTGGCILQSGCDQSDQSMARLPEASAGIPLLGMTEHQYIGESANAIYVYDISIERILPLYVRHHQLAVLT
eukprot:jgi/Botrbrau1/4649/Bobra.33_2s0020.1